MSGGWGCRVDGDKEHVSAPLLFDLQRMLPFLHVSNVHERDV